MIDEIFKSRIFEILKIWRFKTLVSTGNGLVLYGGASSDRWSRVWEGVHHMVQDPKATNDLYFLQMF